MCDAFGIPRLVVKAVISRVNLCKLAIGIGCMTNTQIEIFVFDWSVKVECICYSFFFFCCSCFLFYVSERPSLESQVSLA